MNSNKVIYAQGGLGNQLFQYAFYLDLKCKSNCYFDISRVHYDLQHSGVSLTSLFSGKDWLCNNIADTPFLINDAISSRILRTIMRISNTKYTPTCMYDFDALTVYEDIDFSKKTYVGYFQFVDSLLNVKDAMELELQCSSVYKELRSNSPAVEGKVAMHIRRGDFLRSDNSLHDTCDLKTLLDQAASTDQEVIIFSDDLNWCKEKFGFLDNVSFFDGGSAVNDFIVLSTFNSYIITGSTFSWWAAYFFSDASTEVRMPKDSNTLFMSTESNLKIGWNFKYF